MKTLVGLFASTKYWDDAALLQETMEMVKERFPGMDTVEIIDGKPGAAVDYGDYDVIIALPFSGSVQPQIIEACASFNKIILFAGYVPGNFDLETTDNMLCKNAGPTIMDTYGVLKRDEKKIVALEKNFSGLAGFLKVLEAYEHVKNSKITIIGGPEPWVISVSRNLDKYREQLGIDLDVAPQEELIELYEATTEAESGDIYRYFKEDAEEIVEPREAELRSCARLVKAMLKLIENHRADGIAIACFDLIGRLGVNPCLGVCYINSETNYFAACEGDIDSAVTMLMMQKLTEEKLWMANPCLQEDETINFAHCTAPLNVAGKKQRFILRDHHETSVGASPRVFYDLDLTMSLVRYSGEENALTINKGKSVAGRYEPNCRTQMRIALDDYDHYITTALGCHQVMTFEDITASVDVLSRLLKIPVK